MFGRSAVGAGTSNNPQARSGNVAVDSLGVKVVLRVVFQFVYRKHSSGAVVANNVNLVAGFNIF